MSLLLDRYVASTEGSPLRVQAKRAASGNIEIVVTYATQSALVTIGQDASPYGAAELINGQLMRTFGERIRTMLLEEVCGSIFKVRSPCQCGGSRLKMPHSHWCPAIDG